MEIYFTMQTKMCKSLGFPGFKDRGLALIMYVHNMRKKNIYDKGTLINMNYFASLA